MILLRMMQRRPQNLESVLTYLHTLSLFFKMFIMVVRVADCMNSVIYLLWRVIERYISVFWICNKILLLDPFQLVPHCQWGIIPMNMATDWMLAMNCYVAFGGLVRRTTQSLDIGFFTKPTRRGKNKICSEI